MRTAPAFLLILAPLAAQDNPFDTRLAAPAQGKPPAPVVTQKEIDAAVWKGVGYLKAFQGPTAHGEYLNADELVLLTYIHAGLADSDEHLRQLLANVLEGPLKHTYKVSLQAMCLEELDRVTFQWRLAQCAQCLVDNQCANGQWSYGCATDHVKDIPSGDKDVKAPAPTKSTIREFDGERVKPRVVRRLRVAKKKSGGAAGDNSNSQYASLGLRACFDGGIDVPEETSHLALRWWMESQHPDEGGAAKNDVVSGDAAKTQGWNYTKPEGNKPSPTHAMTAGALGAVCIYDYITGRDYKKDPVSRAGANWLGKHFTVNGNYYYMYGLERAGMLYGVETFGNRNWYLEGARFIVGQQNADGSWGKHPDDEKYKHVWDTCWAILFLKKATRPIATEGGRRR